MKRLMLTIVRKGNGGYEYFVFREGATLIIDMLFWSRGYKRNDLIEMGIPKALFYNGRKLQEEFEFNDHDKVMNVLHQVYMECKLGNSTRLTEEEFLAKVPELKAFDRKKKIGLGLNKAA